MALTPRQLASGSVEELTLEIVRELLEELGARDSARRVSLRSSLDHDLGLGSLERVELLVRCEARFNTRLPDELAQQAETPEDWARAVLNGAGTATEKPRHRIRPPERKAPKPPDSAKTLVDVLRRHTEVEPERVHIHLLEDDSVEEITYRHLLETAASVAAGLRAAGLKRNDTVAIMLPTCADFFHAYFGVVLAGGIAVPIYPPARLDKIEEYVRRQVAILRNAEVRFLIGFDRVRAISEIMRVSLPSLIEATSVDALRACSARVPSTIEPSDTAVIQYTSGSTGDPKGVVLSQSNLLANVRGIGWGVEVRPTDVGVSWLPLYHDMGLIGSWLFCLYYAVPITVLSPLSFLSRPERWLWALHDSRGTLCPAPNFAYELCARKIPDESLEGLDLSAWRVAINAGEPVLPETLKRFAARFGACGFRPESYVPCYGLAESSVALSFPPINRKPVIDSIRRDLFEAEGKAVLVAAGGPMDARVARFVANGRPLPHHEVRIVDDQNRVLGERVQGRLLFRGPSMTSGYYRNPEATAAILDKDGWMDSGDLAYWADGELYITGRLKDCIIKSGRNIVPQEVEAAAAEVARVRKGCVAAFGVTDAESGTERLVVVAETRATGLQDMMHMKTEIMRRVDAALGVLPDRVELVRPHSIPKTSSGKIRRNETRSLYTSGRLGSASRPPWMQVLRLWLEHVGSWARLGALRAVTGFGRASSSALLFASSALAGALARLVGKKTAAKIVRSTARAMLWLRREKVSVQGAEFVSRGEAVVLVANRSGRFDPLVLAAAVPAPFLIADRAALESLPRGVRFLLEPLVVETLNGDHAPPGGRLRERLRVALESGHSVLVLPESPLGASPGLSRFRLDAFHAAARTSSPILPVRVQGTSGIFEPGSKGLAANRPEVRVGPEVRPASELAAWRDRVRQAIAGF